MPQTRTKNERGFFRRSTMKKKKKMTNTRTKWRKPETIKKEEMRDHREYFFLERNLR